MSAEEIRSEHVMIRLKPSEKALLDAKAKERGLKPTQLAYEAVMGALEAKYTISEMTRMLESHSDDLADIYSELKRMNRILDLVDPTDMNPEY